MSTKNLKYVIGADYSQLRREMESSNELTRKAQRELAALEAKQREHRQTLTDLGQGFMLYGAAVTAGLALAGKAAIEWESAFAGVRKTVDGSDAEIAALEGELRKLARTLPATHEEIAGVAEAAGQLGIKRKDIAEFTKVMIDLGNTTNLTAEDAATGLAKLSNIMGTSSSDVDRLGSALVALGNDGASTEADILAMALRIAGAGHTIGLSEASVLSFASALSSVGIEAEAGGSSISRVMVSIDQAVRSGGKAVQGFAEVAGMSADEFSRKYRDDAAGAIGTFIAGLNRIQQQGGNVFAVLEQLGFGEIIVRDTLLRAAGASDVFTKSLKVGSTAWAENNALTAEASKRYETSASKLQVAGNQIKDSLIDVGAAIAPIAVGGVQAVSDLVRAFESLPGPVQEIVTWVGVATAVVGVFGGAALIAVPKVLAFRESMTALTVAGGGMSGALGKMGLFLTGPWGAAIGATVIGLGVLGSAMGAAQRTSEEFAEAGKDVARAIRAQNGAINDSVRSAAAKAAADKDLFEKARSVGISLETVTDAVLNQGNAYGDLTARLKERVAALEDEALALGGYTKEMADQRDAYQFLLQGVTDLVGGKDKELQKQVDVAAATKKGTDAAKDQAGATGDVKEAAKEAAGALSELIKRFNELNGTTLTYREAQRSYIEAVQAAGEALAKNGKTLDINTAAGRENQAALDGQAKAAIDLAEAAARQAEKTGGAAAGVAAMHASLEASRPALIQSAINMGMGEAAAKAFADEVLGIPSTATVTTLTPTAAQTIGQLVRVREAVKDVPPNKEVNVGVLSSEAIAKLNELGYKTRTLPDGTVVVTSNTGPAQEGLNSYINKNTNRRITVFVDYATGGRAQGIQNAYGGVVAFAGGGIWENHRPQVATAMPGTVRVWAEPETDKESYIPWAKDRRPEAVGVLGYTADGFGYALTPKGQMPAYSHVAGTATAAPNLEGLSITGRLRIDGDGYGTLMDAKIQGALNSEGRELYLRRGRG